jgi:hypothetical protein
VLRQIIVEKVVGDRPELALDLLWRFMALAGPTFERVDDSNGKLGEVFRAACHDLGAVAAKASADPIRLANQVFAAVTTNLYGEYDRHCHVAPKKSDVGVTAGVSIRNNDGAFRLSGRQAAIVSHVSNRFCCSAW